MNFTIDNEYIQNSTILFQENLGQKDKDIKFMLCCKNFTLFFYKNKIKIDITTVEKSPEEFSEFNNKAKKFANLFKNKFAEVQNDIKSKIKIDSIEITFENCNEDVTITGEDEQITKFNYYGFNLPKEGITNVSSFSKIKYNNIYSNIDLVFYSNESKLEFDFIVKPSGNPPNIKLIIDNDVTLDDDGNAVISTQNSSLTLSKPIASQTISKDNVDVECEFVKNNNSLSINIDNYNKSEELIIDPVLHYSTYYSYDTNISTSANNMAVNSQGEVYITGDTQYDSTSISFAFISKFNTNGIPIFHTFIMGNDDTSSQSIALDNKDNIYITGYTSSSIFPSVPSNNIFGSGPNGYKGIFVTKLNPTGQVLRTAFIHGGYDDIALSIAVDNLQRPYITGFTYSKLSVTPYPSSHFPFTNTFGVLFTSGTAIFVIRLNDTVDGIDYSAIIHGDQYDSGFSITVDDLYNAYVCGSTSSSSESLGATKFGTIPYDSNNISSYVFKLGYNNSTLTIKYFSYITGIFNYAHSIVIDSDYNAYITGYTSSGDNYPIKPSDNIHGNTPDSNSAVFVTKFNSDGSDIIYSCYLHGNSNDSAFGIALDTSNNVYITGATISTNFPTTNYFGASPDGTGAVFVTKLNASGNKILYSAYLHGKATCYGDSGSSIGLDAKNNFYITGYTDSINFPTIRAYDSQFSGTTDSFVCKFVADENITLEDIYNELANPNYGLSEIKSEVKTIENTVRSTQYGLPVINQNINNVENTLLNPQYGLPTIYNSINSINKDIYNLNNKTDKLSCKLYNIDSKLNTIICLLKKLC